MRKRELVLLMMITFSSSMSWTKSHSVKVLQKAMACSNITDFGPFFRVQIESKGTQTLATPPPNCIVIEAGEILRGPLQVKDQEFQFDGVSKTHTFFLIQRKTDNQKRWIPDYFVQPL